MQLSRVEDIENHTWHFVSMLKSGFEAFCIHLILLMLRLGLVNQTRKVSFPAWRFSNLEKRTNSVEWSKLRLIYCLNFYSRFQTLLTFGEGASLNRQRAYTWKGPEDLKKSFIYFLQIRSRFGVLLCWCYLEVCSHRAKCLHSSAFYYVVGNKREALWWVELVHRWVSVDLWPYTCYT